MIRPLIALACLSVSALAIAQARSGYLPSGTIDILQVLPPAPQKGEARYANDRAIFKATRRWVGTPRWDLATADVNTKPDYMGKAFSCAVGIDLTPQTAPKTFTLILKAGIDTNTQSGAAKDHFKRQRPYMIDKGRTCQAPEELAKSFDYPSGHTTWGWTWGSLLSQIAPDRATQIMARARSYGESRIVCGVHNYSAVEGGRITSASVLNAVQAQPAFQADLAAAKAEIAALRADPAALRPTGCDAEASLVAQSIW
jgi:acid phosphatase (class A)